MSAALSWRTSYVYFHAGLLGLVNTCVTFVASGCETHPDVNLATKKYGIKLFVPDSEGMSEICLRFEMVSESLGHLGF